MEKNAFFRLVRFVTSVNRCKNKQVQDSQFIEYGKQGNVWTV